jgi:hypothetical protein
LPANEPASYPQHAARLLSELLSNEGRYQRQWMRYAQRVRGEQLNEAAVARVLFEYLSSSGKLRDSPTKNARQMKDLVYRGLRGRFLTQRTLQLFISAFNMSDVHAENLRSTYAGATHNLGVFGDLNPPPTAAAAFQRPNFQTVSLLDFHTVGRDGLPLEHRTLQVIRATRDDLRKYPFRFDTTTISVDVLIGGDKSPTYRVDEGLYATDIVFPRALSQGETTTLEYVAHFDYPAPPTPTFRRAATGRIENVAIHVRFSPERLPQAVYWSVWDDIRDDSNTLTQESVVLAPDHTASRYIDAVEKTVVGFEWRW